ncbi:hypothetical protein ACQ4PT_020291 [Festuca glaucescens]
MASHRLPPPPRKNAAPLHPRAGLLMQLWFASFSVVVRSSPGTAMLLLRTHDTVLAGRPHTETAGTLHMKYEHLDMLSSPYGAHWHRLRHVCLSVLFIAAPLASYDKACTLLLVLHTSGPDRRRCGGVSPDIPYYSCLVSMHHLLVPVASYGVYMHVTYSVRRLFLIGFVTIVPFLDMEKFLVRPKKQHCELLYSSLLYLAQFSMFSESLQDCESFRRINVCCCGTLLEPCFTCSAPDHSYKWLMPWSTIAITKIKTSLLHNVVSYVSVDGQTCPTELGGIVGDMETMLFLAAIHQLSIARLVKVLLHSVVACSLEPSIQRVAASDFEEASATSATDTHATSWKTFKDSSCILVRAGFGDHGLHRLIWAAKYACENKGADVGKCWGMQLSVIELLGAVLLLNTPLRLAASGVVCLPIVFGNFIFAQSSYITAESREAGTHVLYLASHVCSEGRLFQFVQYLVQQFVGAYFSSQEDSLITTSGNIYQDPAYAFPGWVAICSITTGYTKHLLHQAVIMSGLDPDCPDFSSKWHGKSKLSLLVLNHWKIGVACTRNSEALRIKEEGIEDTIKIMEHKLAQPSTTKGTVGYVFVFYSPAPSFCLVAVLGLQLARSGVFYVCSQVLQLNISGIDGFSSAAEWTTVGALQDESLELWVLFVAFCGGQGTFQRGRHTIAMTTFFKQGRHAIVTTTFFKQASASDKYYHDSDDIRASSSYHLGTVFDLVPVSQDLYFALVAVYPNSSYYIRDLQLQWDPGGFTVMSAWGQAESRREGC